MKDLLEILFRLLHGDDIRKEMKKKRRQPQGIKKRAGSCGTHIRIWKPKQAQVSHLPQKATLADYIAAAVL